MLARGRARGVGDQGRARVAADGTKKEHSAANQRTDLSEASVVTLYLLPELNVRLMPQLKKLKPGSRIVSHDFDMRGAKPKKVVMM